MTAIGQDPPPPKVSLVNNTWSMTILVAIITILNSKRLLNVTLDCMPVLPKVGKN